MNDINITENLKRINQEIRQAEKYCNRLENSVNLLAVSKNHDVQKLEQAILAGQKCFAESYIQEAIPKIEYLNAKYTDLIWHFIGRIQSNKIKYIAKYFSWVQSITKIEQVESLHNKRLDNLPAINLCIEINLNQEASKGGIMIDEVVQFAQQIKQFSKVKLRGLMAIPAPTTDTEQQKHNFMQLKNLFDFCNQQGLNLDTLSMGMSDDFINAIYCGTTFVRIGTAIFGQRN